jgi:hypothetical protein
MRTAVGLTVIAWSIHSYVCGVRPPALQYCFLVYFIGDFPFCKPVFKLHHVFGATAAWYGIMVPDTPMIPAVYGTELSSPLFIALPYCPLRLQPAVRGVFFVTFFVMRIYRYTQMLYVWNPYAAPYPEAGIVGAYGLYALNVYWFTLMLRKCLN